MNKNHASMTKKTSKCSRPSNTSKGGQEMLIYIHIKKTTLNVIYSRPTIAPNYLHIIYKPPYNDHLHNHNGTLSGRYTQVYGLRTLVMYRIVNKLSIIPRMGLGLGQSSK